ncbi:MAG TPA: hypothetical protein ENG79_03055 [Desulfobacteraceae bacterium]|nr:hypothetical protein [Desulfobacteraceae bacterium]HDO30024.1 hypothetical protein [Desulfobacteraceae bacterium]
MHLFVNNAINSTGCLEYYLKPSRILVFGFTCSDPDLIFSEFLNNPNRFNVVLTRARQKIIIIGSKLFFESVASTEKQLQANACFKNFFKYCRDNGCYFEYPGNS